MQIRPVASTALNRRGLILTGAGALAAVVLHPGLAAHAADACATADESAISALVDRYIAAANAHDTSSFPDLFADDYIQHSGRSPSGLAAQIANIQRVVETWPDFHWQIDDRVIGGDKIVARTTVTATHLRVVQGFAPTGRRVSYRTIDIWRVADGKLAEHWDLIDVPGLQAQLRGD